MDGRRTPKEQKDFQILNTVNYISAKLNTIYIIRWMIVGTVTFVVMMAGIDDLNAA